MKRLLNFTAALLLLIALPLSAGAADYLVPVGQVIALQLRSDTVTVAAFDETLGYRARNAGLRIGDQIIAVNGTPISQAEDVTQWIRYADTAQVTVLRGSRQRVLTVPVQQTPEGNRLGIYLRQGIAGIGTVTWYDPDSAAFGALGHGVSDSSGTLLQLISGSVFDARVESVRKGKNGDPGQLKGAALEGSLRGDLTRNTPQGVFGSALRPWEGKALATAEFDEINTGDATILSTIAGTAPQEYSVEIIKIYPQARPDGRNFLLKVTDPKLLEITGGIVQGMSGSPILQNGRIVGAVTHVLVNDPTTGYGIFIENMLEAADVA